MSEESTELTSKSGTYTTLARKAWTAYLGTFILALILSVVVLVTWTATSTVTGALVLTAAVAFIGYRIALVRSYHLYYDDAGVWLYSGVLPWEKGRAGVLWRDLDGATYFQGLLSWLFKSYTVCIGHRFTKSSELLLTHMARGEEAVRNVNVVHQELARAGQLR